MLINPGMISIINEKVVYSSICVLFIEFLFLFIKCYIDIVNILVNLLLKMSLILIIWTIYGMNFKFTFCYYFDTLKKGFSIFYFTFFYNLILNFNQ